MVTTIVKKQDYVLPIGSEKLGRFAAFAHTFQSHMNQTAVIVGVQTPYTSAEWPHPMDKQVITLRATEAAHKFMTDALAAGQI